MNSRHIIVWAAVLAHAGFASPVAAQSINKASEFLSQGNAQAAYQLLLGEEAQHAGNVEFDYLLGRAALDSGEPAKASLIFERVLAVEPNHAGARLDMGRAYFALGDFPRARSEFTSLQALNPPPAAQATIARYLAAIDEQSNNAKTRFKAWGELAFGRDSNVTAGPTSSTVYLPLFGLNFTVGQSARATGDNYHQLNAGAEITHAIDGKNSVFVAADLRFRNFNTLDDYDQFSSELRGGWTHTSGADTYRAFLSLGDLNLGNERYRKSTSLGGEWRRLLNPREQLSLFGQTARLRYSQNAMKAYDFDQYIVGATWAQQLSAIVKLMIAATTFAGTELEARRRTDGNKKFIGLRAGLNYAFSPEVDLYSAATVQYGAYRRENILYLERRKDRQLDLLLGVNWKFAPGWSLRPQLSRTRNYSNTSINAYQRTDGSITLRKDF
ncbi:MAG TPA: tetratricopeptide repeat protein [Rhodocyclaceae bacterium]|nr:tetratricopeptide repeat protein [Rhodocyclaceae bacterium]